MLYLLTGMIVVILVLTILVSNLYQRVKYLKTHIEDNREYCNKCFCQNDTRFTTNEQSIAELNRVLFIMVDSPDTRNFQERVSIGTILGAVMEELGLKIHSKHLKITKKGENYGEVNRKEAKCRPEKEEN